MPASRLSDDEVIALLRSYLDGATQQGLASYYGIAQATVAGIIKGDSRRDVAGSEDLRRQIREGSTRKRYRRITPEERAEIRRRYQAGETRAALADAFEVSTSAVAQIAGSRPPRPRQVFPNTRSAKAEK